MLFRSIGSGGTAGTVNLTAGTLRLDGGVITTSALLANASAAFQFRSGTLNLSGSGASSLPNELSVGTAGAGTLNVSGGEVTASFLVVHGVDDAINLSGGTLTSVSIDNSNGGMFTQTGGTLTLVGSAAQGLTTGSGNIAGAITGAGRLTKVGPGTVQVSSSLGYTGPTIVNQGTLRLAGTGRLSDSTAVTINTPEIGRASCRERV